MYAERSAAQTPWRSLEQMLRESWENTRKAMAEERERRLTTNTPLSDREDAKENDDDFVDPGDFVPPLGVAGLEVRLRVPTKLELRELTGDARRLVVENKDVFSVEAIAADRQMMDRYRAFLARVLVGVRGFEDNEGAYSLPLDEHAMGEADWCILDEAGLLPILVEAARSLGFLPADQRKNFGASQR